jgi:heme O synthase-like polyprenyltransferase
MICAWIKRQWAQISTKIGALLAALSPVLSGYAAIDPRFGYAGAACGIALVVWNEGAKPLNG